MTKAHNKITKTKIKIKTLGQTFNIHKNHEKIQSQ